MAQEQVKKFLGKLTPEDHGGKPRSVVFTLGNGQTLVACLDDYSAEIVERLAVHGLSQKIGDATSSFSKDRDFLGAWESMTTVEGNLRAGVWASRAGGGTSDLVLAIAKLKKIPVEDAQAAIDKANEEQIKGLKKHPEIKKIIAELAAARAKEAAKAAAGGEELDSLLKGLM